MLAIEKKGCLEGFKLSSPELNLIRRIVRKNMTCEGKGTASGVFIRVARLRKKFGRLEEHTLTLAFARQDAEMGTGRAVKASNLIAERMGSEIQLVDTAAKQKNRVNLN
jgi:hypothetical protein